MTQYAILRRDKGMALVGDDEGKLYCCSPDVIDEAEKDGFFTLDVRYVPWKEGKLVLKPRLFVIGTGDNGLVTIPLRMRRRVGVGIAPFWGEYSYEHGAWYVYRPG